MRVPALGSMLVRRLERLDPLVIDTMLAVAFAGLSLRLAVSSYPTGNRSFDVLGVGLTLAANLPLAARRRAPVATLAMCCAGVAAYQLAGYWPALNLLGPMLGVYTVATMRPRRTVALGVLMAAPVLLNGQIRTWDGTGWDSAVQSLLWLLTMCVFGDGARRLGERTERLAELTRQLAQEQEDRARRAVTEERLRIARELHDVVAHHMSVISIQAGLAWYVFDSDPSTARQALRATSDTGREALEEMRRLLTVLRLEADGLSASDVGGPSPGLAQVGELVERIRASGVSVELVERGERPPLAPGVGLCVYRVIQESLTNVVKHARPASAVVEIVYGAGVLRVRVIDDGAGPGPGAPTAGGGHGLIGMRERASLYGGTMTASSRPEGGYEVRLELPLASTTTDDEQATVAPR
jgi:signal transduction histidine kinase